MRSFARWPAAARWFDSLFENPLSLWGVGGGSDSAILTGVSPAVRIAAERRLAVSLPGRADLPEDARGLWPDRAGAIRSAFPIPVSQPEAAAGRCPDRRLSV